MNKRQVGSNYEELACKFLKDRGVCILEQNFRCRQGEIDIVAREGEYLVFVEVKYRTSEKFGQPEEAVDLRKQEKICRVSDLYRMKHGIFENCSIRYDVVAICEEKITWIKDAFFYQSRRRI